MRLRSDPCRRRLAASLGFLGGLALALVLGTRPPPALAEGGDDCPMEGQCTYKKPNIMFVVDYSTSMNTPWDQDNQLTRWEAVVDTIGAIVEPGSFIDQTSHLALLRYGHDPDPDNPGTMIPNDVSGILDGQALDVEWDDVDHNFYACNGQAIIDALEAVPPPLMGMQFGLGTWTKGALDRAALEIATTKIDHDPMEELSLGERANILVVITDGTWTGPSGADAPPEEDPTSSAAALFGQDIQTYVMVIGGDPAAVAAGDALAAAGGSVEAVKDNFVETFTDILNNHIQLAISDILFNIDCSRPRVMVLLDASSSMLNTPGMAPEPAAMGESPWDLAREAIAGSSSLFDAEVGFGALEDIAHVGLAVFGDALPAPGEHALLVQYEACTQGQIAWALDPLSSCELPGCEDPWGGAPIEWSFKDASVDPWCFDEATLSHMPGCKGQGACTGSGSYLHLGLELVADNRDAYHLAHFEDGGPSETSLSTPYLNILITDGSYAGYSSDAQVQASLESMYASGVITYVIGLGEETTVPATVAELESLASWGSGGVETYLDASDPTNLQAVLAQIAAKIQYDPCCAYMDCSIAPCSGDGDGDGDGDSGDGDGDGDSGDGDSGDGDGDSGDGDSGDSDGDGDTGDPSTDEDSDDPGSDRYIIVDEGCACSNVRGRAHPARYAPLVLLALLGISRRRRRQQVQHR